MKSKLQLGILLVLIAAALWAATKMPQRAATTHLKQQQDAALPKRSTSSFALKTQFSSRLVADEFSNFSGNAPLAHFEPWFPIADEKSLRDANVFAKATRGLLVKPPVDRFAPEFETILGHELFAPDRRREHLEMTRPVEPQWKIYATDAQFSDAFPRSTLSAVTLIGLQHMAYSFLGEMVPETEGPFVLFLSLRRAPDDELPATPWPVSVVLDGKCRVVVPSSYLLQKFHYWLPTRRFFSIWGALFPQLVRDCKANKTAQDDRWTPERSALVSDAAANFNCLHESMCVPSEVLMYSLLCLARLFARYPTAEMRSRTAVLFPDVSLDCAAARNTFGMLRRHLPHIRFVMVPRDVLLLAPNMVYVSKFPEFSYFAEMFLGRVLFPAVNSSLFGRIPLSTRISLVSVGNVSISGRAFSARREFESLLERFNFTLMDVAMPQDERMMLLNHADVVIASHGSNGGINKLLSVRRHSDGRLKRQTPTLVLYHTGYVKEYGGLTAGELKCNPSPDDMQCHLLVSDDNDLRKVTDTHISQFLAFADGQPPSVGKRQKGRKLK
jgi:hypothetical protein